MLESIRLDVDLLVPIAIGHTEQRRGRPIVRSKWSAHRQVDGWARIPKAARIGGVVGKEIPINHAINAAHANRVTDRLMPLKGIVMYDHRFAALPTDEHHVRRLRAGWTHYERKSREHYIPL